MHGWDRVFLLLTCFFLHHMEFGTTYNSLYICPLFFLFSRFFEDGFHFDTPRTFFLGHTSTSSTEDFLTRHDILLLQQRTGGVGGFWFRFLQSHCIIILAFHIAPTFIGISLHIKEILISLQLACPKFLLVTSWRSHFLRCFYGRQY